MGKVKKDTFKYICDRCGKLLREESIKNNLLIESERFILISGSVSVQDIHEEKECKKWTFITPDKDALLVFCHPEDNDCFGQYVIEQEDERGFLVPRQYRDTKPQYNW